MPDLEDLLDQGPVRIVGNHELGFVVSEVFMFFERIAPAAPFWTTQQGLGISDECAERAFFGLNGCFPHDVTNTFLISLLPSA